MKSKNGRAICEVICILQIACWWTVPKGWTPQIARPLGGKPEGISTQQMQLRKPSVLSIRIPVFQFINERIAYNFVQH